MSEHIPQFTTYEEMINCFPEYTDNLDYRDKADDGDNDNGGLSPPSMDVKSDYYKFVWQDDEDFEAELGAIQDADQILQEINDELGDDTIKNHNDNIVKHRIISKPRSGSKLSLDTGYVELIANKAVVAQTARFVSGTEADAQTAGDNNVIEDDDDTFYDACDSETYINRGRGDGESTDNVLNVMDSNANIHHNVPRSLRSNRRSRDARNVRNYYPMDTTPYTKDAVVLPMDEVSMDFSDTEDEQPIYFENRQDFDEELGVDSDDTRPIVTVDQETLARKWQSKNQKLKKAMISLGVVTAIIGFGVATYLVVHLLSSFG